MFAHIFIGLGSNLNHPKQQLAQAIETLKNSTWVKNLAVSQLYESEALIYPHQKPEDHPNYINAVAYFQTQLQPLALLDATQAIENQQGRVRTEAWGPRTLDIDLLYYNDLVFQNERLCLPHPEIDNRWFVSVPLLELQKALNWPGLINDPNRKS
jgi:2-amino-4-hydroxy-6-hydroxymethyldihydropteridine diphosphokinase